MKGPATPLVGSGDPAGGSDWVVESTTSLLRREPWIEVFEEHIRLPDGRLVDDFYTIRLRNFVVVAPLTENGELILIRHYRHGPGRMTRSLPSGFIEEDESPAGPSRLFHLRAFSHRSMPGSRRWGRGWQCAACCF